MKRFYILLLTMFAMGTAFSQTTYNWVPAAGGQWTLAANWSSVPGNLPRTTPNATDILIINKGTTMTITNVPTQSIGRLTISTGTVTLTGQGATETLTIGGQAGTDFIVSAGATLIQSANLENIIPSSGSTADISGDFQVDGTYNANGTASNAQTTVSATGSIEATGAVNSTNTNRLSFAAGASYTHARNGGVVPDANYNDASLTAITGVTTTLPTGLDQAFGHFTWNSAGQTAALPFLGTFDNIDGDFTIVSTGTGSLAFANGSTLDIAGDLIINGGTLNFSRFDLPLSIGQRTFIIHGDVNQTGGTWDLDAGTAQDGDHQIFVAGNWTRSGGTFSGDVGTVIMNGATQVISGITTNFPSLTISSSNATSISVNTTIQRDLTISGGSIFDLSTFTANRASNGGTLDVTGTMRLAADAGGKTGSNFPTNFNTTNLNNGSIVDYYGVNSITQTVFATTYASLTLSNGSGSGLANKITTGNVIVNTTFTVNANAEFTPGATNTITGSTNTIAGSGVINVTRITGTPDYDNQYTFSTDNLVAMTVDYSGAGNQSINGYTVGTLNTSNTGTKTLTGNPTANDAVNVGAGTILLTAAQNLTLSTAVLTVTGTLDFNNETGFFTTSGTSSVVMAATGLIRTIDQNGLGPVANASFIGATITTTSITTAGTVEYYRSATSGQLVTDRDYNNLTITGATQIKTWTLAAGRTVNGNILVNSTAPFTLVGAQTVTLKGNWQNSGTVAAGTSTILFNGSVAQTMSGTSATTFNNLSISNAAGVSLSQNESVNAVLTLTNGVVTTTNGTGVLTVTATGTVPGGGSNASYISGPMTKVGTAAFTFPIGKQASGTGFVPLAIGAGALSNTFTAEYMRGVPPNSTIINPATNVKHISACDYWILNRSAGSSAVTVNLFWNNNNPCNGVPYITNPSSVRVVHYDGVGTWDAASTTPGTGLINAGNVLWTPAINTFAAANTLFTIGSIVSAENPLPVLFADVKAYAKNSGVQVDWSNLTEREVSYYSVERSGNGVDFNQVAKYLPKSNMDDKASYVHFDASPLPSVNYYRIKVVEKSGKVIYSRILRVELGNVKAGVSLYPNPVTGNQLTISLAGVKQGQYNMKVVNTSGQEVYHTTIVNAGTGVTQMIVLPASVKPGVYTTVVTGADFQDNKMFIVR